MKMLLAIAGFALSVVLIAEAGFALPRASSVERLPAVELVGFGCNFTNGKLVCGKSEGSDDADEDNHKHMQDDENDNHKHKKKAKDTGDELTECTTYSNACRPRAARRIRTALTAALLAAGARAAL